MHDIFKRTTALVLVLAALAAMPLPAFAVYGPDADALVSTPAVVTAEEPGDDTGLTAITGEPAVTAAQMRAYLQSVNPKAPDYAEIYLAEGEREGIRGDLAFAMSCLETGNFRFGGDVKASQNNFCGLGATGGVRGLRFDTPEEGIRAQIQHMKAYATTDDLNRRCIDPRFAYVERGVAPYVEWLGIPENPQGRGWAAASGYGGKILAILDKIAAIDVDEGRAV